MTKMEYAQVVAEKVNGKIKEIEKANGVRLIGITKRIKDKSVVPNVYIDEAYEMGKSVEEMAEEVQRIFDMEAPEIPNVNDVLIYEKVKPMLRARLYNSSTKADVFRSASEYGFDDLIIIPYIQLNVEMSVKVTNDLLERWGATAGEVLEVALNNSMQDVEEKSLAEMFGMPEFLMPSPMRIVSNSTRMYGAIGILGKLAELKDRYGSFMVIPSSLHEVIVVRTDSKDDAFTEMIKAVNEEQVAPEERLGDHEYYFGEVA